MGNSCCTPSNSSNVVERPPKHPSSKKKQSIVKKNIGKEIQAQMNFEDKNMKTLLQNEPASPPSQKRISLPPQLHNQLKPNQAVDLNNESILNTTEQSFTVADAKETTLFLSPPSETLLDIKPPPDTNQVLSQTCKFQSPQDPNCDVGFYPQNLQQQLITEVLSHEEYSAKKSIEKPQAENVIIAMQRTSQHQKSRSQIPSKFSPVQPLEDQNCDKLSNAKGDISLRIKPDTLLHETEEQVVTIVESSLVFQEHDAPLRYKKSLQINGEFSLKVKQSEQQLHFNDSSVKINKIKNLIELVDLKLSQRAASKQIDQSSKKYSQNNSSLITDEEVKCIEVSSSSNQSQSESESEQEESQALQQQMHSSVTHEILFIKPDNNSPFQPKNNRLLPAFGEVGQQRLLQTTQKRRMSTTMQQSMIMSASKKALPSPTALKRRQSSFINNSFRLKKQQKQSQQDVLSEGPSLDQYSSFNKAFRYKATESNSKDEIDKLLEDYCTKNNLMMPIIRIDTSKYLLGTKVIVASVMHGALTVRVGGGFMSIDEFVQTHQEKEIAKLKQLIAREQKSPLKIMKEIAQKYKKDALRNSTGWGQR